jgi:hypothetical protein
MAVMKRFGRVGRIGLLWLCLLLLVPAKSLLAAEHAIRLRPNALSDVEWAAVMKLEIEPIEHLGLGDEITEEELSSYLLEQRTSNVESARFDLDGDGQQELIVFLGLPGNSGSAGAPTPVYRRTPDGWREIGYLTLDGNVDRYGDYPVIHLRDEDRSYFFQGEKDRETYFALVRRHGLSPRLIDHWEQLIDEEIASGEVWTGIRALVPPAQQPATETEVRRRVGEAAWAKEKKYGCALLAKTASGGGEGP